QHQHRKNNQHAKYRAPALAAQLFGLGHTARRPGAAGGAVAWFLRVVGWRPAGRLGAAGLRLGAWSPACRRLAGWASAPVCRPAAICRGPCARRAACLARRVLAQTHPALHAAVLCPWRRVGGGFLPSAALVAVHPPFLLPWLVRFGV